MVAQYRVGAAQANSWLRGLSSLPSTSLDKEMKWLH